MTATREIRLSVDATEDLATYAITAECADEATTIYIVDPTHHLPSLVPTEDDLRGEYGRLLIAEHHGRCGSCQRWGRLS